MPKKLLVYGAHVADELEQAAGYGWSLEEGQTGADCQQAHVADELEQAAGYGWSLEEGHFDWGTLIANKNREIERLNGIYRNLLVNR